MITTEWVGDEEMRQFLTLIRYEGSFAKLWKLKRHGLRKELNFYFECITRVFSNKFTNFDVLPIMSDRLSADRGTLYYTRFCQLIFN